MDDNTRAAGVVVPLYTSDSTGRNSPRQLQGILATFVDGRHYAGTGKFKTEMLAGARYIVTEVWAGQKRWEDGRVVECVAAIDGHYPQRHELGYTDQRTWAPGPGGKPADPWQDSREVVLLREVDFAEYTFATSSGGGRAAVDALRRSIQNANLLKPNQLPVIELGWRPMQTAFGMKSKPDFKIVGWWRPEQTTIAPPDNDLNDPLPDFSK
jgi:hypothetical protein